MIEVIKSLQSEISKHVTYTVQDEAYEKIYILVLRRVLTQVFWPIDEEVNDY